MDNLNFNPSTEQRLVCLHCEQVTIHHETLVHYSYDPRFDGLLDPNGVYKRVDACENCGLTQQGVTVPTSQRQVLIIGTMPVARGQYELGKYNNRCSLDNFPGGPDLPFGNK